MNNNLDTFIDARYGISSPSERAIGRAANVTVDDLGVERVKGLTSEGLGSLLAPYRNVEVEEWPKPGLGRFTYNPVRADAEFLRRVHDAETMEMEDPGLAYSEWRAKDLAYLEPIVGAIVPVITELGERKLGSIVGALAEENDGVVARLTEAWELEGEARALYVDFRGTQVQPARVAALASVQRDLDESGIGRSSFAEREAEIVAMVESRIRDEKVVLHIGGHSLGGVDAQRAVVALLEGLSPEALSKVERVVMVAHNAPAAEEALNEQFRNVMDGTGPQVELTYVRFEGDPVQTFGDVYVGAEVESARLGRRVVTVTHPEKSMWNVHDARGFRGDATFRVEDSEEALHHYLCKRGCGLKSSWTDLAARVAEVAGQVLGSWVLGHIGGLIPQRVVVA